MMVDSTAGNHATTQLETSLSKMSIDSSHSASEDWDRSASDIHVDQEPPNTPSTSRMDVTLGMDNDNEGTPGSTKGRRSLSDLLRLHAEKGKDLRLSDEDERRLREELGKWINSDSSPYEPDDDFFSRPSRDDSSLTTSSAYRHAEINGRPRGQSESIITPSVSGSRPGSVAGESKT